MPCANGEGLLDPFPSLVASLHRHAARFVLIGVWGANFHATSADTVFTTQDHDVLLPLDADNLLNAWRACEQEGLALQAGVEPLDVPRDRVLADAILQRRAAVRATDGRGFDVDLTLVMAGFGFEEIWRERRTFVVDDVEIPVARLTHIVRSKAAVGREKDRLFLATHAEALKAMLNGDG